MNINDGQDVTDETTVEELSALDKPAEEVEVLPDSAKEETKEQFEKLKEHNKQLSEKLSKLEAEQQQPKFNSVLDEVPNQSQALQGLSTAQVEDITKGLMDEQGYIDQDQLSNLLKQQAREAQEAKDKAMLAEQRIEKFEETQLVRDVHSKHPALDPYNKEAFNPDFYNQVKKEIQGQLAKGYQDFQAAADKVAAELKAQSDASATQTTKEEEARKVLAQREQASTTSTGKQSSTGGYEDLDEGIRKGDALSIGQRLQANGF